MRARNYLLVIVVLLFCLVFVGCNKKKEVNKEVNEVDKQTAKQTQEKEDIITKDKKELKTYIGKPISIVLKEFSNMKDEHCTGGPTGYTNETLTFEAEEKNISFISIDKKCDYMLNGLTYGMDKEEAKKKLLSGDWKLTESGEIMRYFEDSKGNTCSFYFDKENKIDSINYIAVDSTNEEPVSQEKDTDSKVGVYGEIVQQYKDAIKNNFYEDVLNGETEDHSQIGKNVNNELLSSARDYIDFKVYYSLYDIDQNGTDEFIIGASGDDTTPLIYNVFANNTGKAVDLFPDQEFGYRSNITINKDGQMEVMWSDSAFVGGDDYYKMAPNGHEVKRIKGIRQENGKYYQDSKEITEDQFDDIKHVFAKGPTLYLDWSEIK